MRADYQNISTLLSLSPLKVLRSVTSNPRGGDRNALQVLKGESNSPVSADSAITTVSPRNISPVFRLSVGLLGIALIVGLSGCLIHPDLKRSLSWNRFTGSSEGQSEASSIDEKLAQADQEFLANQQQPTNLGKARSLYEEVLTSQPENATAHHRLAIIADKQQQYSVAEHHYKSALQSTPNDPDLLHNAAYSLILRGQPQQAEGYLQRALQVRPDMRNAAEKLARVQYDSGRQALAAQTLSRVMEPREVETAMAQMQATPNQQPVNPVEQEPQQPMLGRLRSSLANLRPGANSSEPNLNEAIAADIRAQQENQQSATGSMNPNRVQPAGRWDAQPGNRGGVTYADAINPQTVPPNQMADYFAAIDNEGRRNSNQPIYLDGPPTNANALPYTGTGSPQPNTNGLGNSPWGNPGDLQVNNTGARQPYSGRYEPQAMSGGQIPSGVQSGSSLQSHNVDSRFDSEMTSGDHNYQQAEVFHGLRSPNGNSGATRGSGNLAGRGSSPHGNSGVTSADYRGGNEGRFPGQMRSDSLQQVGGLTPGRLSAVAQDQGPAMQSGTGNTMSQQPYGEDPTRFANDGGPQAIDFPEHLSNLPGFGPRDGAPPNSNAGPQYPQNGVGNYNTNSPYQSPSAPLNRQPNQFETMPSQGAGGNSWNNSHFGGQPPQESSPYDAAASAALGSGFGGLLPAFSNTAVAPTAPSVGAGAYSRLNGTQFQAPSRYLPTDQTIPDLNASANMASGNPADPGLSNSLGQRMPQGGTMYNNVQQHSAGSYFGTQSNYQPPPLQQMPVNSLSEFDIQRQGAAADYNNAVQNIHGVRPANAINSPSVGVPVQMPATGASLMTSPANDWNGLNTTTGGGWGNPTNPGNSNLYSGDASQPERYPSSPQSVTLDQSRYYRSEPHNYDGGRPGIQPQRHLPSPSYPDGTVVPESYQQRPVTRPSTWNGSSTRNYSGGAAGGPMIVPGN